MYTCSTTEIVFEVTQAGDGSYRAECLTEDIDTQADSWEDLRPTIRQAVEAFFSGEQPPGKIRLRVVHDELLALREGE